jgi:MEMO1 family protein
MIRRVILLGPSHRVAFPGVACSSSSGFATPLGIVRVGTDCAASLVSLPGVAVSDEAHAQEHALEVQLPFLQTVLDEFSIVPLLTGEVSPEVVGHILEALWGGLETRIVVSSDLSHYLDASAAMTVDEETSHAIEALDPGRIGRHQACGRTSILGLLHAARGHRLEARTLDLRNSGDTAGPRDRVVGYGAFAFTERPPTPTII